ncbi:MAG: thioredoxin domain-containing protein [Gammaproteobacteria bacterium]|nr:thioredoxin domain-containing protein [Gammaproteobacteria bacterium]
MTSGYCTKLLIALFACLVMPAHAALENQLKQNSAPYLAMHGQDPVLWQQWNSQILERARRENKLIFVSVGFFSCYWCHVMQRESFRDAEVARVLNESFIPVVVDRELDPALDAQLLQFVERFRGAAGWPLNVFITPQGHPILGGVYFPRQEFLAVLARLAERWKSEPEKLSALAEQAAHGTPHFEKMLYDNALLANVYLRAARIFKRPEYEQVARETLDFMLKRMRAPQGGFYSSLSAVDELGVEGAYYLWNEPTLQTVLDASDSAAARAVWGMRGAPPFEAGYLPVPERDIEHVATELKLTVEQVRQRVANARKKLLAVRDQRQAPIDTKIIAGWNGLVLIALTEAAALPGGESYAVAAHELRDYLVKNLLRKGQLLRTNSGEENTVAAVLEDYAYVAAGLLRYATWSKKPVDTVTAGKLVRGAWQSFYRPSGWVLTDHSVLPDRVGEVWIEDGALPSPSAWLIAASLQVAKASGDAVLQRSALDALARGGYLVMTQAFNYASHVPLLVQLPR